MDSFRSYPIWVGKTVLLILITIGVHQSCVYGQANVTVLPGSIKIIETNNARISISSGNPVIDVVRTDNAAIGINIPPFIVQEVSTSTIEFEKIAGISIYPNPTIESLTLTRDQDSIDNFTIEVRTINGTSLLNRKWEKRKTATTITMATYPRGVYFIQLTDLKNNRYSQYRVVKQ